MDNVSALRPRPTASALTNGSPVDDTDVARLRSVLEVAAVWYRERVVVDRPGVVVELLARRGLADLGADTALGLRWLVGFAPSGPAAGGVLAVLRARGFSDAELVAAGVAGPGRFGGGVVPVLRGRLVVPLVDAGGVVGFSARRICDGDAGVPKWVNTATTALYRKGEDLLGLAQQNGALAAGRGSVVLVEGALDAVAVDAAGHVGLGAGGTRLTPAHAAQLRRAVERCSGPLLVAYDADPAGAAATDCAAGLLGDLDARAVELPAGGDPAELLAAQGTRGLRRALGRTRPLVEVVVAHRQARWDRHTGNPVALVEAVHDVAELVLTAPAGLRGRLVGVITARTGLPVETVTGALLDDAVG